MGPFHWWQAALLAIRAAEEQLGEALSPSDADAREQEASSAAAAVAGALELTFTASAAAAARSAGDGTLRGRLLDVLGQLAVPLINHMIAAGRDAQVGTAAAEGSICESAPPSFAAGFVWAAGSAAWPARTRCRPHWACWAAYVTGSNVPVVLRMHRQGRQLIASKASCAGIG